MNLKKLFLIAAVIITSFAVSAQGIQFVPEGTTFKEALELAKKENKKVFLDCYTSWCGPCRMMSTKIFPMAEVGDFMNPQYVAIKIDMEKGEGPALARRLDIAAYPTFVFFNADGDEIGRFVGGGSAEKFIANVKENVGDGTGETLDERFAKGERDPQFLNDYLAKLTRNYRRTQAGIVAEAILEGKAQTFTNDTTLTKVFMNNLNNPYNEAFVYTVKNPDALIALKGKDAVDRKIANTISTFGRTLILVSEDGAYSFDQAGLDKLMNHINSLGIAKPDQYRLSILMNYYQKSGDIDKYVATINEYVNNPQLSANDRSIAVWANTVASAENVSQATRDIMKGIVQNRLDEINAGKREAMASPNGDPDRAPVKSFPALIEKLSKK